MTEADEYENIDLEVTLERIRYIYKVYFKDKS